MEQLSNKMFDQIVEEVFTEIGNRHPLYDRVIDGNLSLKLLEYDIYAKYDEILLMEEAVKNKKSALTTNT